MPQRWQILQLAEEADSLDGLIDAVCSSSDITDCDLTSARVQVLELLSQYQDILPGHLAGELDKKVKGT